MIRYVLLVLISLPLLVSASPSDKKQDYKCHIISAKGDKVIFYRWKSKDVQLKSASLIGQQLTNSDGEKYFIKDVSECVTLGDEFSTDDARRVDQKTLR
jgi:hypothetical protein